MKTIVYGFLGCGGVAAIAYMITQFMGGDLTLDGIMNRISQILPQKRIKEVNKKIVENILPSIEKEEKIAEESKKKIIDIQKKAATEITEILKQGDIDKIHGEIEKEWANI